MSGRLARRVAWAVAGGLTHKLVRRAARRVMHTPYGDPRLPVAARKHRGFGKALAWAAGTGAVLALTDVMREQERRTVQGSRG